jgi:hypothetical protein
LDVAKRLMDYDFHPPTNYFRSVSMKRWWCTDRDWKPADTRSVHWGDAELAKEGWTAWLLHDATLIRHSGGWMKSKLQRIWKSQNKYCWLQKSEGIPGMRFYSWYGWVYGWWSYLPYTHF